MMTFVNQRTSQEHAGRLQRLVGLSNTAGDPAVVYHDDPDAAQADTWTEWLIPLQKFAEQGVDLADVDWIAIGFGVKDDMTAADESGTMYFDDIRLY